MSQMQLSNNAGVLIKKLIDCKNEEIELYKAYKHAISSYESEEDAFNQCISDLKMLSSGQYDFSWITREAKLLSINRKDYRELCEIVSEMLGSKIKNVCIKCVCVTDTNFEDYCPHSSGDFIYYTAKPIDVGETTQVKFDGDIYETVSCKPERTPYYEIYGTYLELDH